HYTTLVAFGLLTSLRSLSAVLAASLHSLCNALSIQCTTDNVITYTWQVLNSATTDQHYAVLLQVVAYAWNVAGNFDTIGQLNSCDFSQRGVWLLRCHSLNSGANASLLRRALLGSLALQGVETSLQCWCGRLLNGSFSALLYKLV